MLATYLTVTLATASANIFSATCDFVRYKQVSIAMAKAGVPESWMTTLGILKTAGALGLLVGIGVPLIGTAAAAGLVLHRRHRDALARTRLLVRAGGRVPAPRGWGAGAATGQ